MNKLDTTNFTATFKTPEIRDLAWVMLSPGLINAPTEDACLVSDQWCQKTYVTHIKRLHQLDEHPEPLLNYLSALNNHRLGFYFETLLAFWFEHIIKTYPFRKNVPVFQETIDSGRRTIGEFDFLFGQKDPPMLNHWEVTVKFYLCHENATDDFRWLGPAGRDQFDRKLSRILEHQLKLAETPEGHSVVEQLSTLPVNAEAFIKGYLFYPAAWENTALAGQCRPALYSSLDVSTAHLRGWWLRFGEVNFPKQSGNSRWLALPKLKWLSAAWCIDAESDRLLDDASVVKYCAYHLKKGNSSLLLAEMQWGINGWFEVSRGFVVAPSWPTFDR